MSLPEAAHETIAHFLTDFPHHQALCKTEEYIRKFLARRYASDVVDEIILKHYKGITSVLIDEYDDRRARQNLLRYRFVDNDGERVRGIGASWTKRYRIFQDALNGLTDSEFEALSARLLAILGCDTVWTTPTSHDQGLDSFGYSAPFSPYVPREIRQQCRIVFLAQAKHYNKHKIGSRDLREFVGAVGLALHKIFSTVDEKYAELTIKPFGPTVMVLLTTQELPCTVKTIGRNAGILVLSAQDLAIALTKKGIVSKSRWTKNGLVKDMRKSLWGIPRAK